MGENIEIDGYAVSFEEAMKVGNDAAVVLKFNPVLTEASFDRPFNEYLVEAARDTYGQDVEERAMGPYMDEVIFENERWSEVNNGNECCGLNEAKVKLSGAELKELAPRAHELAQGMRESLNQNVNRRT